jgi:hypothetical protein
VLPHFLKFEQDKKVAEVAVDEREYHSVQQDTEAEGIEELAAEHRTETLVVEGGSLTCSW